MIDNLAVASALEALAARLKPSPPIKVSKWLTENIVLVDGDVAGHPWSPKGAPYLPEIADCLGDDHPCNLVTVRKSQQSGASILALGWTLFIADREPANTLYAVPGIDTLRTLNTSKLQPLIDAWQKKIDREIIEPQTSRSGSGSTTYEKVFTRGRLWLANANAVMDLSSVTAKKGVKDELSKWQDIPGYGDPETLFFGRFTAFRRRENWKILEISTPEVDSGDELGEAPGHCRIDRSFKRSDQRYWFCKCPQCSKEFVHEFRFLKIDEENPQKSFYICQECGMPIDDTLRAPMIRAGAWRPTAEGPDRHPGFHIDAFISLMMSYKAIAQDFLAAKRNGEKGRKDFSNLVLGLPHLYKGDAPDHVRLMERREEGLTKGHVPPKGILLLAAADVQMRGVWVEIIAISPDRQTWVVDAFYCDGSTETPGSLSDPADSGNALSEALQKTVGREFPDAFGRKRTIDALAIDAGYRSHVVYATVRNNQRLHPSGQDLILATDGLKGWNRPAIGTPSLVDIDLAGHRVKQGCKLWGIGTWSLKGSFYADLGKLGIASGAKEDPGGYCHFPKWLDENYFKQITAEFLRDKPTRDGRSERVWDKTSSDRDNHFLDCRVYNLAIAEYLGLSSFTTDEWAALAKERGVPPSDVPALFRTSLVTAEPPKASGAADSPKAREPETPKERLQRLAKLNAERWQ